ncbi:MAG: sensor domain-containing diguanylate cyclase [bacterium]|nr:sensor domain-containing diguanylate cyclase [bacterium]
MMVFDDLLQSVTDKISDGLYVIDPERKILYWNKSAEIITGYLKDEVIGFHCYDNILRHIDENGRELCKEVCPVVHAIENNRSVEEKVFLHHKDGHRVPVLVKVIPIIDKNNITIGAIELFTELIDSRTLKKELETLRSLAFIDELTGVLNRRGFEYFLGEKKRESERFKKIFGVLFVDIDDFKLINDTYGHKMGDKVLKMVAETLKSNLKINDIVARYGGDEFVVISEITDRDEFKSLANRISIVINSSFIEENGKIIRVSVSIGGAISKGKDLEMVLEKADNLMYVSKAKGKNRVTLEDLNQVPL